MDPQELFIELRYWDYECGDGCCYDSGTTLHMNGEELEHPVEDVSNSKLGENVKYALVAILKKLGYNAKIVHTNE